MQLPDTLLAEIDSMSRGTAINPVYVRDRLERAWPDVLAEIRGEPAPPPEPQRREDVAFWYERAAKLEADLARTRELYERSVHKRCLLDAERCDLEARVRELEARLDEFNERPGEVTHQRSFEVGFSAGKHSERGRALAAEKRVAELEEECNGWQIFAHKKAWKLDDATALIGEAKIRCVAAEAELRRLREDLSRDMAGWDAHNWAPAHTFRERIRGFLVQSEARYPLPAEEEHRGSRAVEVEKGGDDG